MKDSLLQTLVSVGSPKGDAVVSLGLGHKPETVGVYPGVCTCQRVGRNQRQRAMLSG